MVWAMDSEGGNSAPCLGCCQYTPQLSTSESVNQLSFVLVIFLHEKFGSLILILPEIAAHELGRNTSSPSLGSRLCHVSSCFLPSQCKTLFPFTSHYFFPQNAFSADNAHEGTIQPVV